MDDTTTMLVGQLKITSDGRRGPVERYYVDENDDDDEEEEEEEFSEDDLLAQMGYAKSGPNEAEEEGEDEDLLEDSILTQNQMGYLKNEPPKHEPINIPIEELNLVSALKGSHEKEEGRPAKGCRVSWAPDVYDPPCTSDDHFTESRTERHNSEDKAKGASGKNRQKSGGKGGGKGDRGGGSSKGNEGGSKAGRGSKEKKRAEKKHKKRGEY